MSRRASVRLCKTFVYSWAVEVIWSDEAVKHLARSQRYPDAVDIDVAWTVEAVNDVDAVQVDPYWTSRINALAIIGYSPGAGSGACRARLPGSGPRSARHDRMAGHRPRPAALHRGENFMSKRLDPKVGRALQEEATRAEAAAEANPEAEFRRTPRSAGRTGLAC